MRSDSSTLSWVCDEVRRLKPGQCIQFSTKVLGRIPPAHLKGPLGPEWSPVDQVYESIVGSSYDIASDVVDWGHSVRFCRLVKTTEGECLTHVSPDRRDHYSYDGLHYFLKPQAERRPVMSITKAQAIFIRARFESTEGWSELAEQEPKLVAALEALPDETLMSRCLFAFRELFADAKCDALRLVPNATAEKDG